MLRRRCILCVLASLLTLSSLQRQADAFQLDAEAVPGHPFGIGRVSLPLTAADAVALQANAISLTDAEGRTFYPTFTSGTARRFVEELVGQGGGGPSGPLTVYFLFKGDAPLTLTLTTAEPRTLRVVPRPQRPRFVNRLWRTWWREYNAAARIQADVGDYPPLIETYLTSMLGRRLGMEPPLLSRVQQQPKSQFQQTLDLLLGVEEYRAQVMRNTVLGRGGFGQPADLPVPRDVFWSRPHSFPVKPEIDIEPIAHHVPHECFYIRFGTWANQVWLKRLMQEYGGDISRMISLRGHDAGLNGRLETQLATHQSLLSELLGGNLIADVAVIGRDTFLREGAAIGVLLQAKNDLLTASINQQRRAVLNKEKENGATLQSLEILGHKVSLLSTPDNRIRSFYAVDGSYHLVTSSRVMVERFFEAGAGNGSLGQSAEFQFARAEMPTSRKDTVFIYMSTAFFQGLLSPQYQIELQRRIESVTDMELVQLARLAARNEGAASETIGDLVRGGFLPTGFGRRPDGSGPIIEEHRVIDSLRGARGTFLPIPDVKLHGITAAEAQRFVAHANYYAERWAQLDPLMVGIRREMLDDQGHEHLVVDAKVSPFGEEKYGWIFSILGPPLSHRVVGTPHDIISFQASVRGGLLLPSIPPHHLFAAVQDDRPPATDLRPTGFFKLLEIAKTTPGYLGAWPKPGFLDILPIGLGGQPDPEGFTRSLFGLWRWQGGGFSLLSFEKGRLAFAARHVDLAEDEVPAQIRLSIGDLAHSNLRDWLNSLNYSRARQASLGNTRLLHAMTQQLRVPGPEARQVAESLLDVKLVCALGGEYLPSHDRDGMTRWYSDHWDPSGHIRVPVHYEAPLLRWFRGLDASVSKLGNQMAVHLHLDMQRETDEPVVRLPMLGGAGAAKDR